MQSRIHGNKTSWKHDEDPSGEVVGMSKDLDSSLCSRIIRGCGGCLLLLFQFFWLGCELFDINQCSFRLEIEPSPAGTFICLPVLFSPWLTIISQPLRYSPCSGLLVTGSFKST